MKKRRVYVSLLCVVLLVSMLFGNVNIVGATIAGSAQEKKNEVGFVSDDKKVTGTKTANWVEGNDHTKAQITFNLKEPEDIVKGRQTNIVLVIDKSGSMGKEDKLVNAQTAAKDFIAQFLGEKSTYKDYVKMSVVSFEKTAVQSLGWSNHETDLKNAVDALKASGGTNIQDGIRKAQSLLNDKSIKESDNNVIVLLCDGDPTYSYKGTGLANTKTQLNTGSKENLINTFNYNTVLGNGEGNSCNKYLIQNSSAATEYSNEYCNKCFVVKGKNHRNCNGTFTKGTWRNKSSRCYW